MFARTRDVERDLHKKQPKFYGSIAEANRWDGKPHKHERERRRNGYTKAKNGRWVKKGGLDV